MYFDPGTGSAIIQLLVVLVASCGGLWFAFRKKITALFKKDKTKQAKTNQIDNIVEDEPEDMLD